MGLGAAGTAAVVAGGIGAAGAVGSGLIGAGASKSAAGAASNAQMQSALLQQQMFEQTRAGLAPYNQAGQSILPDYTNFYKTSADQLGAAFNRAEEHIPQPMTEANLIQTPGYQFNLSQGLRAVQNSNAAKGIGVSGPALTGAAKFATGLADSTYTQQFQNQQQIYQDYLAQAGLKGNQLGTIFGQLGAPVSLGENAAATQGNIGATTGANIGNSIGQAGNAQAAGITGGANALQGALTGLGNSGAFTALALGNALGSGGGGGYNPAAYGYSGDPNSAGAAALQSMGFFNPLVGGSY